MSSHPLAVRQRGLHPLHVLWELEVWPGMAGAGPGAAASTALAGEGPVGLCGSALQEIFHTEDQLTLADVPRLCCELPGIAGCLLARDRDVVASHNIPEGLRAYQLLSSAGLATDRAAGAGTAGWGEPEGLTLHLKDGDATLVRRGAAQLLVLHAKRGFAPGVWPDLLDVLAAVARVLR
jgi:hypothetical protein